MMQLSPDPMLVPCPHDETAATLHDPARRGLLLALDTWEARWPPGGGYGHQWVLAGLWHLQLWHPRHRVSALVFHGSRWLDAVDLHIPEVGRLLVRSPRALARALDEYGVEAPPLERARRLAAAGFARALTALGERALGAMSCPVHGPMIPGG